MKQKRQKHSEMFTQYLQEDEYLIWLGEPQDNRLVSLRHREYSIGKTFLSIGLMVSAAISAFQLFPFSSFALILPLILFLLSLLSIFRIGKKHYAISNQRYFVLEQFIVTTMYSEAMASLPSIKEDEYNSFSLNFVLEKKVEEAKQEFPMRFLARRIEDLNQQDARTAYELLKVELHQPEKLKQEDAATMQDDILDESAREIGLMK